jgi:hypothetical protein
MLTDVAAPARPPADVFMRRLLRLPADAPKATAAAARRAFQTSIMVATFRCLLMYIVLPFVLPALGLAKGVAPAISLPINAVAIAAIVTSMRRFWRADHPKRWWYTAIGGVVLVLLLGVIVTDVVALAT